MVKSKITYYIISSALLVAVFCADFYGCNGVKDGVSTNQASYAQSVSSLQSSFSSTVDSLEKFKELSSDYTVVDVSYQKDTESGALMRAAISYYDKKKNTNSNVAIISDSGIALIDLAGGNGNFSFAEGGKLTFTAKDAVTVALIKQETNQIYDFEIRYEYIPEQKMTNVVTSSKIRQ